MTLIEQDHRIVKVGFAVKSGKGLFGRDENSHVAEGDS